MTHVHLGLVTKPVILKQFLQFQGRSMECLWAWIILMLLTCVKPGFEYVGVGAVRDYSPQCLVGYPEAEEMPVLSDMNCLVFVEKSLSFFFKICSCRPLSFCRHKGMLMMCSGF